MQRTTGECNSMWRLAIIALLVAAGTVSTASADQRHGFGARAGISLLLPTGDIDAASALVGLCGEVHYSLSPAVQLRVELDGNIWAISKEDGVDNALCISPRLSGVYYLSESEDSLYLGAGVCRPLFEVFGDSSNEDFWGTGWHALVGWKAIELIYEDASEEDRDLKMGGVYLRLFSLF